MATKANSSLQSALMQQTQKHRNSEDKNSNDSYTKCNWKTRCWIIFGILLLIFVIQFMFIPQYINHSIKQQIVNAFIFSKPDMNNDHYRSWITNTQKGDVPIEFSVRFYNITNPNEVLRGAIPKLYLTKPIVYDEFYQRKNVSFSADGDWVTNNFYVNYIYNKKKSGVKATDVFTVFSPLISTVYQQYYNSKLIDKQLMKKLIEEITKKPELLFVTKNANALIFDAYEISIKDPITNKPIYNFSFGLMNNESNHYYVLNTGNSDMSKFGEVERYCFCHNCTVHCLKNDSTQYMSAWNPPMSVSPGHLFYVGLYVLTGLDDKNDISPLWITTIYRNIYLQYNKTYKYKGIDLWRYHIENAPMLLNSSEYPPNAQYYQYGPSGMLNLTAAYDGLPIFLSLVLFDNAPDYLANNSKLGLRKPQICDVSYIDFEPRTGAIFHANASLQVNSPIYSLPNLNNESIPNTQPSLFNLSDDMMIPIYILTYSDAVTDGIVSSFRNSLNLANGLHTASVILGYVSIGLFSVWALATSYQLGKLRLFEGLG